MKEWANKLIRQLERSLDLKVSIKNGTWEIGKKIKKAEEQKRGYCPKLQKEREKVP